MVWQALPESELRKLVVQRAAQHHAFWLLPVENESVWRFGNDDQAPVLRNVGLVTQEFLASTDEERNHAALASVMQIENFKMTRFWSMTQLDCEIIEELMMERWGIYEPLAREKVDARKKEETMMAVFIRSAPAEKIKHRVHNGFPDPVQGWVYRMRS